MSCLKNITVLDLTRLLPGPFATMILADYGARVIKIEPVGEGDYLRWMAPTLQEGMSAPYAFLNRNKEHLSLNLKKPEGKEIFLRLVQKADVLIEGFRPGVMARLDLDYESLEKKFPRLIYCSLTGYGQTGPLSQEGGHDLNYMALSGVLSLIGAKNGPPTMSGVQLADLGGGALYAVIAIAFALLGRGENGPGQHLDISMMDGSFSFLSLALANFFSSSQIPNRGADMLSGSLANYNLYETKDGKHLALGALEPKFWIKFCQKLNRPDLMEENSLSPEGAEKLKKNLSQIFLKKDRDDWMAIFKGEDICLTPVLNIQEALDHPQIQSRKLISQVAIPGYGPFPQLAPPMKFSKTPGKISSPPQPLGAQTKSLLQELGYTAKEVEKFQQEDVV